MSCCKTTLLVMVKQMGKIDLAGEWSAPKQAHRLPLS